MQCKNAHDRTVNFPSILVLPCIAGHLNLEDKTGGNSSAINYKIKLPPQLSRNAVYTNSELRLSDVDVVGFDYDYTLAPYTQKLDHTIFKMILQRLVDTRHYPSVSTERFKVLCALQPTLIWAGNTTSAI